MIKFNKNNSIPNQNMINIFFFNLNLLKNKNSEGIQSKIGKTFETFKKAETSKMQAAGIECFTIAMNHLLQQIFPAATFEEIQSEVFQHFKVLQRFIDYFKIYNSAGKPGSEFLFEYQYKDQAIVWNLADKKHRRIARVQMKNDLCQHLIDFCCEAFAYVPTENQMRAQIWNAFEKIVLYIDQMFFEPKKWLKAPDEQLKMDAEIACFLLESIKARGNKKKTGGSEDREKIEQIEKEKSSILTQIENIGHHIALKELWLSESIQKFRDYLKNPDSLNLVSASTRNWLKGKPPRIKKTSEQSLIANRRSLSLATTYDQVSLFGTQQRRATEDTQRYGQFSGFSIQSERHIKKEDDESSSNTSTTQSYGLLPAVTFSTTRKQPPQQQPPNSEVATSTPGYNAFGFFDSYTGIPTPEGVPPAQPDESFGYSGLRTYGVVSNQRGNNNTLGSFGAAAANFLRTNDSRSDENKQPPTSPMPPK